MKSTTGFGIVEAVRVVADSGLVDDLNFAPELLIALLDEGQVFCRLHHIIRITDDVDDRHTLRTLRGCFSDTKRQYILRQSLGPQHDSPDFGHRQRNWRPAFDGLCEEDWFPEHRTFQTWLMPPHGTYGFPPKLA
jgi:hypothetical protein